MYPRQNLSNSFPDLSDDLLDFTPPGSPRYERQIPSSPGLPDSDLSYDDPDASPSSPFLPQRTSSPIYYSPPPQRYSPSPPQRYSPSPPQRYSPSPPQQMSPRSLAANVARNEAIEAYYEMMRNKLEEEQRQREAMGAMNSFDSSPSYSSPESPSPRPSPEAGHFIRRQLSPIQELPEEDDVFLPTQGPGSGNMPAETPHLRWRRDPRRELFYSGSSMDEDRFGSQSGTQFPF